MSGTGNKKARLARLERATYGLEVRCSIQLSYRRVVDYYSGFAF